MYINWLGANGFKIQGKDTTLVIDPYGSKTGLRLNPLRADIVISSGFGDIDIERVKPVKEKIFQITGPGEYESGEVFIYGIGGDQSTLYVVEIEGVSIAHLAGLDRELNEKELELVEDVDAVLLPVGGGGVLDAQKASDVVAQVEPRIVIPMDYEIEGYKTKRDAVKKFTKEMGVNGEEPAEKLHITKKEIAPSEMKVVLLRP